jgi:large subunit ribosomal protein L32e
MMSDTEKRRLLRVRKRRSQSRPYFKSNESWRLKRISDRWRKPKGIDNKMRTNESGWPRVVNVGWGGPAAVRGLHPSGKKEVMVYNVADLATVNPETCVARIGRTVGKKKRIVIVEEAGKLGVRILNSGLKPEPSKIEELEEEKK